MTRRTPVLGAAAVGALALLAPAAASAATVTLNQPCYAHIPTKGSEPIVATLAGGTPGANFIVAATVPGKGSGSAGSAEGTFDAAGNGTAMITDVSPPSGTIGPTKGQIVNISVQDFGAGGAEVPAGTATITNVAISVARSPRSIRAHRTVSVSGTAFANQSLYAFVTSGSSGTVLRRISLGKANACGFATAKGIVAPASYRPGKYRLYINAGSKLDKSKAIYSSFSITRSIF